MCHMTITLSPLPDDSISHSVMFLGITSMILSLIGNLKNIEVKKHNFMNNFLESNFEMVFLTFLH
jgi:hypothetical protein